MGEVYKAKEMAKEVQLNVMLRMVTLPLLPSTVMTDMG